MAIGPYRIAARHSGRAGEGNRTLVCSLGSCRSTIELHPRRAALSNPDLCSPADPASAFLQATSAGRDRAITVPKAHCDRYTNESGRVMTRTQESVTSTEIL